MKSVTASEARKNWSRLLDEASAGEVVQIRRGSERWVLRRETSCEEQQVPNYETVLRSNVDHADRWGWDWDDAGLTLRQL